MTSLSHSLKKMKRLALGLVVPFLVLFSLLRSIVFLKYYLPARDDYYYQRTAIQSNQHDIVSVYVYPHFDRSIMSNVIVKHLYEDGIQKSSVLQRASNSSSSSFDANLVWIVDPQAAAASHGKRPLTTMRKSQREEAKNWCLQLLKNIKQTQQERKTMGHAPIWPIHFVDNKDGSRMDRCEPVEKFIGANSVHHHQRGVVEGRSFNKTSQWVDLGNLMTPPNDIIHFHHKPIGVRTDVVQEIKDALLLQEPGDNNSLISSLEESIPRPIDLSYFWQVSNTSKAESRLSLANNNRESPPRHVQLRNLVFHTLQNLQHVQNYNFSLGLTGERGEAGRRGISREYILALLKSKIVVVTQRDQWEDQYRLMEALVAGPLVMTDTMLSLPQGLQDGVSIVEYNSTQDLQLKVEYYLQHPKERMEIARRGRHVAMSRYRSWHQLEQIIFGRIVTTCVGQECYNVNASKVTASVEKQNTGYLKTSERNVVTNNETRNHSTIMLPTNSSRQHGGGQKQLLICGGRGTTATRTVFEATCRLGIPSVHWKMQCMPNSLRGHTANLTIDMQFVQVGLEAHQALANTFMSMLQCLVGERPCPDVGEWRQTIMDLVDKVISSGIGALHDTPYSSIMTYLLKSAQRQGVVPTVVLSERDPSDWTRSRSMPNKKQCGMDPICKERYTGDGGGPFDVFTCMDRALQKKPGGAGNFSLLNFSDIFTNVRALADSGNSDRIVFAMKEYQDWLRPLANFTVNVFERTNRLTPEGLAMELAHGISLEDGIRKKLRISTSRENRRWFG